MPLHWLHIVQVELEENREEENTWETRVLKEALVALAMEERRKGLDLVDGLAMEKSLYGGEGEKA